MSPEEEVIKVESKPKKGKKGLIIAAVVLFLLLLLFLGVAWFAFRTGMLGDFMSGLGERRTPPPRTPGAVAVAPDYMFEMPEILVNLDGEGTRSRFLSIKFYIGYENARLEDKLVQRTPEIRDQVLRVLWDVKSEEILTAAGKERLRQELHETIQDMFYEYEILGIYFWHVMIQ